MNNLLTTRSGSLVLASSLLLTSCMSEPSSPGFSYAELLEFENKVCRAPLREVTLIDQSGSMKTAGTQQVQAEEFQPLIDRLSECGGELSVLFIREDLGAGPEHLFFPEPPSISERPVKTQGEEEYEFSDRTAAYHAELIEAKKQTEKTRTEMTPKIDEFLARMRQLLARAPAGGTDFNSAINNADIFLSESDSVWNTKPEKYLIVVSDAIDTRKRPRFVFKSGAHFYWVNTTTDVKTLAGLEVTRFQNFASAVRNVTSSRKLKEE